MELPFDCRNEARQRFFIAAPPRQEQARYIGKRSVTREFYAYYRCF
jgi:hypothetical protein